MAIVITFNFLAAFFLLYARQKRARGFDAAAARTTIQRCRGREDAAVLEIGSDSNVAALYQSWLTPDPAAR